MRLPVLQNVTCYWLLHDRGPWITAYMDVCSRARLACYPIYESKKPLSLEDFGRNLGNDQILSYLCHVFVDWA